MEIMQILFPSLNVPKKSASTSFEDYVLLKGLCRVILRCLGEIFS